jgi:hypothetical protein
MEMILYFGNNSCHEIVRFTVSFVAVVACFTYLSYYRPIYPCYLEYYSAAYAAAYWVNHIGSPMALEKGVEKQVSNFIRQQKKLSFFVEIAHSQGFFNPLFPVGVTGLQITAILGIKSYGWATVAKRGRRERQELGRYKNTIPGGTTLP